MFVGKELLFSDTINKRQGLCYLELLQTTNQKQFNELLIKNIDEIEW